jgi:hypothetical protein
MDESAKSSKNAASEAKGVGDAVKNLPGSKTVKVNIDVDPTPLRKTLDSFDGYTVYVNPKSRTGNRAW